MKVWAYGVACLFRIWNALHFSVLYCMNSISCTLVDHHHTYVSSQCDAECVCVCVYSLSHSSFDCIKSLSIALCSNKQNETELKSISIERMNGMMVYRWNFNWFSIWIRYAFKLKSYFIWCAQKYEDCENDCINKAQPNQNEHAFKKNHFEYMCGSNSNISSSEHAIESCWSMPAFPFHFYLENEFQNKEQNFNSIKTKNATKKKTDHFTSAGCVSKQMNN